MSLPWIFTQISTSSDIFSLFSNESGSYVVREEMEKMLHVVDGKVPESLKKCFSEVFHAAFLLLHLQKSQDCIKQLLFHTHARMGTN